MEQERREGETTVTPQARGERCCPFGNPDCGVTCECGDDECHRYCLPRKK